MGAPYISLMITRGLETPDPGRTAIRYGSDFQLFWPLPLPVLPSTLSRHRTGTDRPGRVPTDVGGATYLARSMLTASGVPPATPAAQPPSRFSTASGTRFRSATNPSVPSFSSSNT